MNKWLRCAVCVVPLVLAGCGGGGNATPTGTPAPTVLRSGIQLVAGDPGGPGSLDGTGDAARFTSALATTIDPSGNLWAADNGTIRRITADGVVATLAGVAGQPGMVDGTGTQARVNPSGIVSDASGDIYFTQGTVIRKMTPAGLVSTVQGSPTVSAPVDGDKATARFAGLAAIAIDAAANLYVADDQTVRKITPAGAVTTLAGSAGLKGYQDGSGQAALFSTPSGLAVDAAGNVFVADSDNRVIRRVTPAGVVTTVAGSGRNAGTTDGAGAAARFSLPISLAIDPAGTLYVTDSLSVRKVSAGVVTTVVAAAPALAGYGGIARDAAGNLYVTHAITIDRITPAGAVSPWVGRRDPSTIVDGTGAAASFASPACVVGDAQANAYVTDAVGTVIRKVDAGGTVTSFAGSAQSSAFADGSGAAARFRARGLAIDAAGNIYVADNDNSLVRKITPAGVVSTLAGVPGQNGYADGAAAQAKFAFPGDVAVDTDGVVYVADSGNNVIRTISPSGEVATLAGNPSARGSADGTGAAASFDAPGTIFVDGSHNVYVSGGNGGLRRISRSGAVTTVAAGAGVQWFAADAAGNVYGTDVLHPVLRKLTPGGSLSAVAGSDTSLGIRPGDLPGSFGTIKDIFVLPPQPATAGTRLLVVSEAALLLVTVPE